MTKPQPEFPEMDFFIDTFGEDVYAVGGYVRDLLLGNLTRSEVDLLITHHTVEQITDKLEREGKANFVGKSFGVIKFTTKGRTYDIALPRIDKAVGTDIPGHKDFEISTSPDLPVEKDLERRDFTCNSIAYRLHDKSLIDPFNGSSDIKAKVIRVTNPTAFPEDPLRVLRAARFASVLGFSIDKNLYEIAKNIDLSRLSVERVAEELFKILLDSASPSVGLEELFRLNALMQLFPELYRLTLCLQDSVFHPEKDAYGHHTVWQHTKITVDQAQRLAAKFNLTLPERLALLLASLFHDAGKSRTTQWEFKKGRMVITSNGHDVASARIAEEVFERIKLFSWSGCEMRKTVPALIRCHHRASELWANRKVVTKKAFNRLAADIGGEILLLVLLDAADRAGRVEDPISGLDEQGIWLLEKFDEMDISKESIKPVIKGRDLISLGLEAGPDMGIILKSLYQLQLDNRFEGREQGLKMAKKLIKEGRE